MYIIDDVWQIIKDFLIIKPKEKWFPPELWRQIKNYQLGQEYWKQKFNYVIADLPKCKVITAPSGRIFKVWTTATRPIQFVKTFEIHDKMDFSYPIVTYKLYSIIV